jgi:hypothetical protein
MSRRLIKPLPNCSCGRNALFVHFGGFEVICFACEKRLPAEKFIDYMRTEEEFKTLFDSQNSRQKFNALLAGEDIRRGIEPYHENGRDV